MSTKCECGKPAVHICANCTVGVCDDINCGTDTVDGYLCGTYTQWGCSKKYTTCDECLDDKAIHEGDFVQCDQCGNNVCETCGENFIECDKCNATVCEECKQEHNCE
jgi:hypothetical protein